VLTISTKVLSLAVILILAAVVTGLTVSYNAKQQPARGVAVEELAQLYQPEIKPLGTIVLKTYREFRGNTVRWSAAYFGCLFGSAFLSAVAALILKLELLGGRPKLRNDLAASFATLAALLITLSTIGDFQRKWQANRIAAAEMENLAYELTRPSSATHLDAILTRIQTINTVRHQTIAGKVIESKLKASPMTPGPAQSDASADAQEAEQP
jgi:hypothetical protein